MKRALAVRCRGSFHIVISINWALFKSSWGFTSSLLLSFTEGGGRLCLRLGSLWLPCLSSTRFSFGSAFSFGLMRLWSRTRSLSCWRAILCCAWSGRVCSTCCSRAAIGAFEKLSCKSVGRSIRMHTFFIDPLYIPKYIGMSSFLPLDDMYICVMR